MYTITFQIMVTPRDVVTKSVALEYTGLRDDGNFLLIKLDHGHPSICVVYLPYAYLIKTLCICSIFKRKLLSSVRGILIHLHTF